MRRVVRFAAPWLLALGLAGCSADSQVVARVGDRVIRADDLVATARVLAARGALPPDSAKIKLLNALIQRELLVRAAHEAGLHRDTAFMDLRDRTEKSLLRERMVGELVAGPIEVSEAEVARLHSWRAQETRARVIFTQSREAADAALHQIRGGIDFALVANRFNPPGFTPPGGDIGFVTAGFLQPPLDDLVRTGVPGRLYGPVEAPPQGWFVVRVEERRPRTPEPLEAERSMLTEVIRQRKQVVSVFRSVDRLKTQYAVRVLPGASQELMARVLQPTDSTGRLAELSTGEQAAPLVVYQGGAYSLGDAFAELQSGNVNRPNFQSMTSVEHWLEARAIDRVLLREAQTRGYADEPALQRALRERLNDYLLETYYSRMIVGSVLATDAQAQEYYRRDPQAMAGLQQVRAMTVTLADSAAAAQLVISAPQSEGLREAVTTAGLGARVRAETVSYPNPDPIWTALEPVFQGTAPGGYAGPFQLPTGWLVVQLIDKTQGASAFETLAPGTQESFRHLATEQLRSTRLRALTDSLRREYPVTIYQKRLDRLEFPSPVMLGGGAGIPGM